MGNTLHIIIQGWFLVDIYNTYPWVSYPRSPYCITRHISRAKSVIYCSVLPMDIAPSSQTTNLILKLKMNQHSDGDVRIITPDGIESQRHRHSYINTVRFPAFLTRTCSQRSRNLGPFSGQAWIVKDSHHERAIYIYSSRLLISKLLL